jgi:hypothetical protein
MIKLEQQDGQLFAVGRRTLRDLLLRRADQGLSASEAEVESCCPPAAATRGSCRTC